MQFIDEEAEVDDEDEEEELDEDDINDETHPDDVAELPVGGEHDDRRHRELDRQRERAEEIDAEKQAEMLRQRYGRQRAVVAEASGIPQHLLLPSVEDPSIWAVRCKPGKENDVVNAIMKRFADRLMSQDPLDISACFARAGSMAGYVYVEARKQPAVLKAIENIPFCYANTITLIDIAEMPDLLKVRRPKEIKIGQYVKMKRPVKYAGDLAQVLDVESNASEVTVKLVPRIDYGEEDSTAASKRKRPGGTTHRPPARLFTESEARKKAGRYFQSSGRKSFTFQNEQYENGFLIKTVKFNAIETENVHPTLEEASKFAASAEEDGESKELDLAALAATIKQSSTLDDYLPGDMVEIFQGEQQGVKGKTIAVHSDIVTIDVTEGVLRGQTIEAPTKTLRKLFREGDAVKVLANSKYHGESGLVLKVQDDKVTLLTDANRQEITVFSRDLRVAQDSGAPVGGSKYDLYEMVQLDAATVGCVVKVDRETIRVLDQNGVVRTLLPSNISDKLDKKRPAIATDRDGTEIHVGDVVDEVAGKQRKGDVTYIHRNYLWCHDKHVLENAGMFVARGSAVQVTSAKGARPIDTPDLTKMNPALRNGANGVGSMPPPAKMTARDRLEGREVLVVRGPSKGLKGRVRDVTSSYVRIEFHTKAGLHPFSRDVLKVKDPHSEQYFPIGAGPTTTRRPPGAMGGPPGPGMQSRIPMGARTPLAAGSNAGSRTPAWGMGNDGGKTPAWKQGNDGGKTPAWGAGARTPAWQQDGSRTVAHWSNDGSRTAYGGVSFLPL
jgi:transcription elongation factor SPT5